MDRETFINRLRTDLLQMVRDFLSPVALKYGYSEAPLEANIKWRPQVLVLGNYSSGKSTLINDFLGAEIQATGQAPTDDSFTVITYDENASTDGPVRVTEERDGKYLLNDPEYPYEILKKHGQRFASHFRLKKVNARFLRNLALIDTPGMLDSITERDRGYNYQEVIGDFAQIADLVLVLFDPHKAGTVQEAHVSLRDTLPARTFEDRVLFVLNRIDECASLIDLLQVYGTLCWNLSQMTGRKDIPTIHLTYSPEAADTSRRPEKDSGFLQYLGNQRERLKRAIQEAPRHRLDHLASFVETHGERLSHLLEALIRFRRRARKFYLRYFFAGILAALSGTAAALAAVMAVGWLPGDPVILLSAAGGVFLVGLLGWMLVLRKTFWKRFVKRQVKNVDTLTALDNQSRRDNWESIAAVVRGHITKTGGVFSLGDLRREYDDVNQVYKHGGREIREALNELAVLNTNDTDELDKWIQRQSSLLKTDPETASKRDEGVPPA